MKLFAALCALVVVAGCSSSASSTPMDKPKDKLTGDVTVFAASSLKESFTAIGKQFEKAHPGVHVTFNFGASSALAQSITQGAPADVFAAASPATMKTASADIEGTATTFAKNTLQIAVPAGNPGNVTGLADFAKDPLKIAVCAKQVPCGSAAVKVFASAGITPKPDTYEQDVKAALSKVELGEVDAALVYRTDVIAAGPKVKGIDFPESLKAVNDYPIGVLTKAPNHDAGAAFEQLVLSKQGQDALTRAGFQGP
ncbi:MAG: molybdate transport system substrate-binding protein [Cryptosporangiaceae bacterium]|nr:molybdate transport system substrate-binding protein [Cryptosporangiaceae bacterium]